MEGPFVERAGGTGGGRNGKDEASRHGGGGILVAGERVLALRAVEDDMVVVGAAYDADGILPAADDLGVAFFDLRSGHAGELFQKVTNYGQRLALVLSDAAAYGPRWPELAFEHARHRTIRFFTSAVAAEAWLRTSAVAAEAWLRGGDVRPVRAAMRAAAGGKNLWIVGGGDLAGQFFDAGLLDDLIVQVGPLARATVATEAP